MAKISLRMYNREIEGLIEQSQRLDEAIAHCRHILKTYPKHLETYRMLGKAYLEAKRYDQAVDIFQRVLLAAPDDFVSHVGMSIIADDKGKLDEAIWHMERAFEVQPSNAAIQGELQRLFGRRDGVEPPKIRLTRGALAHMYLQGELFPQAISETRAVLANDPKRTDMQTLLARAYFRNGQKAEAAEICAALLGKYPYCLDANRLMAEIAPGTQKADTAGEYRNRVIELDPYAAFIQDSLFRVDTVSDNLVTLDRFEYTGEAAEMPGALGLGLEGESAPASRMPVRGPQAPSAPGAPKPADLPAWLQGSADEAAAQTPAAPPAAGQEELPDFLRQAGWGVAASTSTPETPPPFVEQPAAPADSGGAVEGELPAWVKALAPSEESATPAPPTPPLDASNVFGAQGPEARAAFAADTPDWLRDLGGEAPSAPAAAEPPLAQSEAPTLPVDVPDWMRELGPVPPSEGPAAAEAETPDWLKDLGERELDEPVASAKSADLTDWLGDLRSEQAAATPVAPAEEESPDWLKEFSNDLETPIPKTTAPEPPAAVPTPAALAPEAPEAGTLGTLGTTAQEQDDAMAWLESLAAKHGAKPEELVTDPNARTDIAPEWVDKAKEIGEGTGQAMPAEDETGMWLRSLAAEAETTEPPQAAIVPEVAAEAEVPVQPEPAAQPEPEPEAIPEVKPFDFRSAFEDQTGFAESEPPAGEEEAPVAEDFEKPAWMRDLAKKPAERPGMEDAPDWLRGISREAADEETFVVQESAEANVPAEPLLRTPEAQMPAPAEPAEAAELSTDLPAWLAGLDNEQPEMTAPSGPSRVSDELPAWLQAEAEPEPEVQEPANPADWHPMGSRAVEEEAPASETMEMPEEAQPAAMDIKTQPIEPPPPAAAKPEPLPAEKAPTPKPAPAAARPKPAAVSPKLAALSLGDAQTQLGRGNIAAALDIYGKLIRKGKSLEDIIRDLRDALYRYPVEVPLWQSLGDAYMRANRLQEALDAYTKAEELLR